MSKIQKLRKIQILKTILLSRPKQPQLLNVKPKQMRGVPLQKDNQTHLILPCTSWHNWKGWKEENHLMTKNNLKFQFMTGHMKKMSLQKKIMKHLMKKNPVWTLQLINDSCEDQTLNFPESRSLSSSWNKAEEPEGKLPPTRPSTSLLVSIRQTPDFDHSFPCGRSTCGLKHNAEK